TRRSTSEETRGCALIASRIASCSALLALPALSPPFALMRLILGCCNDDFAAHHQFPRRGLDGLLHPAGAALGRLRERAHSGDDPHGCERRVPRMAVECRGPLVGIGPSRKS